MDGQIRRVKNTTFASTDNSDVRNEVDPSSANGDMRLIPLLEIEMTGDAMPLAMITPTVTVQVVAPISATITMTQSGNDVDLVHTYQNPGTYTVEIVKGSCGALEADVIDASISPITDTMLVDLADGAHALRVSDGTDTACANIPNIVNGPYRNRMIDPAPLKPYGISVREKDDDGTLLAYVPVYLVEDETGGGKAAFQARMLYWPAIDGAWQKAQAVRLTWAVQMLTDACDDSDFVPSTAARTWIALYQDELRTWCADPAHPHQTTDQVQIVHPTTTIGISPASR